jgi:hypothetical protein
MTCDATYRPSGSSGPLMCLRQDVDVVHGQHRGRHFAIEQMPWGDRLWTWDDGGAHGYTKEGTQLALAQRCVSCATPSDTLNVDTNQCFFCKLWTKRAKEYNSSTSKAVFLRPHNDEGAFHGRPYLYCWSEGTHGGFGERKYIVRHDDGREFGPNDSLWGSGGIPWEWEDQFPSNCTIEYVDFRRHPRFVRSFDNDI